MNEMKAQETTTEPPGIQEAGIQPPASSHDPNFTPDGRLFAKGNQIGKLGGRPHGSRHKLGKAFLSDIAIFWQREGGDILQRVARDDPSTVLRVIASLVPKELMLKFEGGGGEGIVINLLGVNHPLAMRDITPAELLESELLESELLESDIESDADSSIDHK